MSTVFTIGHSTRTIAEFVENREILELVRTLGVDHAQGYEIARPLPLTQILAREFSPTNA